MAPTQIQTRADQDPQSNLTKIFWNIVQIALVAGVAYMVHRLDAIDSKIGAMQVDQATIRANQKIILEKEIPRIDAEISLLRRTQGEGS